MMRLLKYALFGFVGLVVLGVILQWAGVTPKPTSTPTGKPVVVAWDDAIPSKATKIALDCGVLPRGYTATYLPERRNATPMVDVTVRGAKPTPADAGEALRSCLEAAAKQYPPAVDVFGTVWYSASGKDDDDSPVAVGADSDHLVYAVQAKAAISFSELSKDRGRQTQRAEAPKVDTSKPVALSADVSFNGVAFKITNTGDLDWSTVKFEVNGGVLTDGYIFTGDGLAHGKTATLGALNFAKKDGTRLNPAAIKPQQLSIHAALPNGQIGRAIFSF